jgi:quinoprotein glucose dehydrogenase
MGMGAIDQFGGHRTPETERFATSILALDIKTGHPRWVFQTVHHDLWDMDVPAQPALVDLTIPGKGRVPALVQSTKTGNIFVLDRRTGQPIQPVREMRVPGGAAPGDFTSPTQPVSAISLMPPRIREADMWGATLFDQMACRIAFRRYRHEGPFTPPSIRGTLVFPGNFGVMDWGGLAIDPVRQVAFAHPNYMAFVDRLIPQGPAPAMARVARLALRSRRIGRARLQPQCRGALCRVDGAVPVAPWPALPVAALGLCRRDRPGDRQGRLAPCQWHDPR